MRTIVLASFIMMLLSACGGGSSSPSPARPSPPVPSTPPTSTGNASPIVETNSVFVFGQTNAVVGEAVGYGIAAKQAAVDVQWQQSAGPSVNLLATNSQGMGFDVTTTGEYSFVATVQQVTGQVETITLDLSVSAAEPSNVQVRLDHAVVELGKVSLDAQTSDTQTVSSIQWTQISGPQIQQAQYQDEFVFFNAPSVTKDEIIVMRAEIEFNDGSRSSDDAIVTVKNVDFDTNGLFYTNNFIITEDMQAYNTNSRWKDAIENCVYNNQIPSRPNCSFSRLPLIGSQTNSPTVQDVLNRTLVSHAWMGDRFKAYLENSAAGPDMLKLLRGVTAVVISYDVRPSFYWVATGAIYLDANNFWETPQERDTLNDQADFRTDFGDELNFSVFWRYTKDNQYYPNRSYEKQARETRSFRDMEASISWLMYHELAHANDFFPPSSWQGINTNITPLDYFQNSSTNSDLLASLYPLRSDEMHALAAVRFGGNNPNDTQKSYRGNDIESFFSPDIAPSFYAYYTIREDFATLVERFLMLYRLDAEADLAIIDGETENDFNVVWGQRNRISEPALAQRTAFAVSRVYPELGNIADLQGELPSSILMNPANGWFTNLNLSPNADSTAPERTGKFNMKQQALLDQKRPHEQMPELNKN
jgi:hypothetical protein